jgi:hypothetical protein
MSDPFLSEPDYEMGKVLKYQKPNQVGEDVYLSKDGVTIHRDEDKIIKVQQFFKHNYYKPGGRGATRVIRRLEASVTSTSSPPSSLIDS